MAKKHLKKQTHLKEQKVRKIHILRNDRDITHSVSLLVNIKITFS